MINLLFFEFDVLVTWVHAKKGLISISARDDVGITELLDTVLPYIPYGPKYYNTDTLTTRNERFFASEIIRECILNLYKVRYI